MEIGFRQREKFSESTGMLDDSQNLTRWTVTTQTLLAPLATPAREVNLADNATAYKARSISRCNFSDEFVTGSTRESVIAAKKLQVCVADASAQKANYRITFGPAGLSRLSYRCPTSLKVNRNHFGLAYHHRLSKVMERIQ